MDGAVPFVTDVGTCHIAFPLQAFQPYLRSFSVATWCVAFAFKCRDEILKGWPVSQSPDVGPDPIKRYKD
ncbi:unnamed protein product [Boreogadus saida]